jgi:hypothetical protein
MDLLVHATTNVNSYLLHTGGVRACVRACVRAHSPKHNL